MYKKFLAIVLSVALCVGIAAPCAGALNFEAASVFVMDGDTGEELYSYYGDTARVPASMTKVLTAYIIYQELEKGTITLDTPIKISHNVAVKSRDSNYPMAVPLMNETAKSLGLNATYYNCHGAQPNYITARSQAKLTKIFIDTYPDILRITSKSGVSFNGSYYNNTNHMLNTMAPYEGLDGFKTGTIAEAGYCVTTTAVRNGRRVIAVVMKSTSDAQRFADSRQLLDYGFQQIELRNSSRASTTATITSQPASVRPYESAAFTVQMNGVSTPYAAKAQWYVDGQPVEGYGNSSFSVSAGKTSTLNYTLRELTGSTLSVAFVLTMPDGTEKRAETTVTIEQRPVSYTGSLNIQSAAVYPGKTLTVTADIEGKNEIARVQLPAGWYWDGEPITNYTNNAFTILNDAASSSYTLKIPEHAAPGAHTLSFIVGQADSTGVEQLVLTADVEIVSPSTAEDTAEPDETTEPEQPTETDTITEPDAAQDPAA